VLQDGFGPFLRRICEQVGVKGTEMKGDTYQGMSCGYGRSMGRSAAVNRS
jgi:hypothetical protein